MGSFFLGSERLGLSMGSYIDDDEANLYIPDIGEKGIDWGDKVAANFEKIAASLKALETASTSLTAPIAVSGLSTVNTFELIDCSTAAVIRSLPVGVPNNSQVGYKLELWTPGNNLTVQCTGADVINKAGGSTSVTLSVLNQAATFQYRSGVWVITSSDIPRPTTRLVAAAASANWNEAIFADTTTGAFALALPAAVTTQAELIVANGGSNALTLTGIVSGITNPVLYQYSARTIRSNGSALYFA